MEAFGHLLQFIYTDYIDKDILKEKAIDLVHVAHFCGVVRLKQIVELELIQRINIASTVEMILLADRLYCAALKEDSFEFFSSHASEIMATKEWTELNKSATLLTEMFEFIHLVKNKRLCIADLRNESNSKGLCTDGTRKMLEDGLKEEA